MYLPAVYTESSAVD